MLSGVYVLTTGVYCTLMTCVRIDLSHYTVCLSYHNGQIDNATPQTLLYRFSAPLGGNLLLSFICQLSIDRVSMECSAFRDMQSKLLPLDWYTKHIWKGHSFLYSLIYVSC